MYIDRRIGLIRLLFLGVCIAPFFAPIYLFNTTEESVDYVNKKINPNMNLPVNTMEQRKSAHFEEI